MSNMTLTGQSHVKLIFFTLLGDFILNCIDAAAPAAFHDDLPVSLRKSSLLTE
jgi:hypothetical protein